MVKSPKSSKSSRQSLKKKPYAVYKGKELKQHAKPNECRQQIVDNFHKKILTLPVGETGVLVVLPADKRGPVRVASHNLTVQQAAAIVKALNRSLPYPQQRLTDWVSKARARKKLRRRRLQAGEELLLLVTYLARS
jgi:hypothetical protein